MRLIAIFAAFALMVGCSGPRPENTVGNRPPSAISQNGSAEQPQMITVYFGGAFIKPGRYSVPAGTRLLNAINAAGGLDNFAARKHVYLTSQGKRHAINVNRVKSGSKQDPVMHDGDKVWASTIM